MCLAIPARIIDIRNDMGTIDMDGAQRDVSLLLLEDAEVGCCVKWPHPWMKRSRNRGYFLDTLLNFFLK